MYDAMLAETVTITGHNGDERIVGEVAGAAAYLRGLSNSNGKVGVIGHCSDDQQPSPEHVAELEAALKAHGKTYEFHSYDGAGHAFMQVDRINYRPEAAVDAWEHIWAWFGRYLLSS